jgi:hypothetical protein
MVQSRPDGQHIAFNQRLFRVLLTTHMIFRFYSATWVDFYVFTTLIRCAQVLWPIRCRNFSIKAAD